MTQPKALSEVEWDAFGFAILRLDLAQELTQGCLVTGVAGHDFVGEWKTFRRDDRGGGRE